MNATQSSYSSLSLAIRLVVVLVILPAIWWIITHHDTGGLKGLAIPPYNVSLCICVALLAACLSKRIWIGIAVPFVAGIVGVFGVAGLAYGPYGGVLGFLVGCLVLVLPIAERKILSSEGEIDSQSEV